MSDTFSFRAAQQPLRKRVDPRALKAGFAGVMLVIAITMFARWVIASERASEAPLKHQETSSAVGNMNGATVAATTASRSTPSDREAQGVARRAAQAAQRVSERQGGFSRADQARLSRMLPAYSFVDGPSPAPTIVSVAVDGRAWAAAVRSSSGGCFSIQVNVAGRIRYGTGGDCTGVTALSASEPSW